MSLKPGWYRIRKVSTQHPDPGPGGSFITLLPDGQVRALGGPTPPDSQRWYVETASDHAGVYKIVKFRIPGPSEGLREGLLEDTTDIPVIFGPGPEEWRIFSVGVGHDVYQISPNKRYLPGSDHLVTTEQTRVVVKPFPVVPGDRPAWQFEKTNLDE